MGFMDGFTRYYRLAEEAERKSIYYDLASYGITGKGIVIYVETPENGGDDNSGDGSVDAPFATIERALKQIPTTPPTTYFYYAYIKVGPGEFDLKGEYHGSIRAIRIIGSFNEIEDVNITSGGTIVSGKAGTRQNTCDPFTTNISEEGRYFLTKTSNDSLSRGTTYLLRPSTSPVIKSVTSITAGTGKIVELATRIIRTSSSSFITSPNTYVDYYNLDFYFPVSPQLLSFRNFRGIYGSIIRTYGGIFTGVDHSTGVYPFLSNCYFVDSQIEWRDFSILSAVFSCIFDNCKVYSEGGRGVTYTSVVFLNNSISYNGYFGVANYISNVTLSSIDFENCNSAVIRIKNPASLLTINNNVTLENCSSFLEIDNNATATRYSGTITGATTSVPINIIAGQVTNFKAGCNGTLTNATTPGNEITVGAAGTVSFSSLPKNDLSTGDSSTFSRAS